MPIFHYRAQTLSGKTKIGSMAAKNERELARLLKEEGLFLVSIQEAVEKKSEFNLVSLFSLRGVPLTEKIFFARYLAVMLQSGVSIIKALTLLVKQVKSQRFKKVILGCREEVEKGSSLSAASSKYPDVFSELFISIIQVGEESGKLGEVLNLLADQMQKELDLQNKIKGAMMYPAVIILAMLGIGFFMLVTVVPKLSALFAELEIELPTTTKLIILIGNLMAGYWYLIPVFLGVSFFALRAISRSSFGKLLIAKILLSLPFFKHLVRKINSARMARTLSSLIKGGVPIVTALEVTARTLASVFFRNSLLEMAKAVEKGSMLHEGFARYNNIYPDLVVGMIEVGEETGTLSDNLIGIADFYEEEISRTTANLSSIIEPILMLLIGGVVGFFAVSMIQPMYSMLQAI